MVHLLSAVEPARRLEAALEAAGIYPPWRA
jgi:hypothetical protein